MSNVHTIAKDVVNKIDLCRGLFAILVVIAHALDIATVSLSPNFESTFFGGIFKHTFGAGFYWVMGFFVISGFCIELSCQKLLNRINFPLKYYTIARLSRILPLYLLCLFLTILVEFYIRDNRFDYWNYGINTQGLFSQFFVIQNLTITYGSYAPSWTITNEIFYYALHGILLTLFPKSKHKATFLGMMFCALGSIAFLLLYLNNSYKIYLNIGLLLLLGIVWYFGVIVAKYHKKILQIKFIRIVVNYWSIMLFIIFMSDYYGIIHPQFRNLFLGVAFSLMILSFLKNSKLKSYFTSPKLTNFSNKLGMSSYPVYLMHGTIMILLASKIEFDNWIIFWLVLTIVSVFSGWFGKDILEKPVVKWRRNILLQFKR